MRVVLRSAGEKTRAKAPFPHVSIEQLAYTHSYSGIILMSFYLAYEFSLLDFTSPAHGGSPLIKAGMPVRVASCELRVSGVSGGVLNSYFLACRAKPQNSELGTFRCAAGTP